jgi:hypothetical protein
VGRNFLSSQRISTLKILLTTSFISNFIDVGTKLVQEPALVDSRPRLLV